MGDDESEVMMVAHERAAYIAFYLAQGREFSTKQVVERTGLTMQSALRLLKTISRVIPIYEENGIWRKVAHWPPPWLRFHR